MRKLEAIVSFCDEVLEVKGFKDFVGAYNGLQVSNRGSVSRIGAAVDGDLEAVHRAVERKVDFLIVHHGLYWNGVVPLVGVNYEKFKYIMDHHLAVYGAHLPLDGHGVMGNNAIIAREMGLEVEEWIGNYEGRTLVPVVGNGMHREELKGKLEGVLGRSVVSCFFGAEVPKRVAICSGSGGGVIPELVAKGIDTLITGEVKQGVYAQAQEARINLLVGGHYATEVFGVKALAEAVGREFGLEWEFIKTGCPF